MKNLGINIALESVRSKSESDLELEGILDEGITLDKFEGIASGWEKEDREVNDQINWKDGKNIKQLEESDLDISIKALNSLGLSSHLMGSIRETAKAMVTDNIDQHGDAATKIVERVSYGKNVVKFKEKDYLRKGAKFQGVIMSEDDFTTQLMPGLSGHKKKLPMGHVMITGRDVAIPVKAFMVFVKAQQKVNNVDLVISFDRKTVNSKYLRVLIQNPKNYDRDRPGKQGNENAWTLRTNREGFAGKTGV